MNPDESLRTKNLAEDEPAPMDETLGGYPWLPRMIDKARASRAGLLGSYFKYPCPIDRECLRRLAISAAAFAELAARSPTGRMLLEGLESLDAELEALRGFDPVLLNASLHSGES